MLILPVVFSRTRRSLQSVRGAFDLPSILTGVLVVAVMTLGVAALVFGAIPFTQNKASAQDLAAVTTAQGVAKVQSGRYLSLGSLRNAGYIAPADTLAVATDPAGTCFVSVSRSGSGQMLISTDQSPTPVELATAPDTGCVDPAKVTDLAGKAGGPGPAPVMTTVWDTRLDPSCSTITLPLTGTINATIDWGDGTPAQAVTSGTPELLSHTYAGPAGIKTIRIDGTFTGWVGTDWPTWSTACITEVTEWGETGTTDVEAGFYDTAHLNGVARIPGSATKLGYLFAYTPFNKDISGWDTSNVTDMSGMFLWAEAFNQPIGSWDTSSVTNTSRMLNGASSFNQPIGAWDTSNVTDMNWMFYQAVDFNQPIGSWNTSKVTDMSSMFAWADSFSQPLGAWDTSSVTDMNGMFVSTPFNQPVGGWDTSLVTNMSMMFDGADSFNQPIGAWDTSSVREMQGMFNWADSFNQPIGAWDTSSVINMSSMFIGTGVFNQPIGGWDTSLVTNMTAMFAMSHFNQDLSGWNTARVATADWFSTDSPLTPDHLPPGAVFR